MKKTLIILFLLVFVGCVNDIQIQTIKSWEGHYMSVDEFKKNTSDIQLDKKESIWVISNDTLKRTLKNIERRKQ